MRDSVPITIWPSGGLCLVTDKKNNKSRAEQEPRSAHGRAVNNKSRVKQEPRSAHGRAVNNNKSRVKQEPRSAHGRAVNKSRAEQEPRSAHGRAVNNSVITIAHNFQGYHIYFVLEELYRQGICPNAIVNGANILSMSMANITFED